MHIGRQQGHHGAFLGRSLASEDIEARDPSLINLPIPVPSIPLINPLVSPLIGGSNPTSTKTTAAASPTTSSTPPSTPTPSPTGSSGGGSSTGGSGSGGSPSGSGSSGSSSGSGDTGGSGSGSGSSGSTGGGDTGTTGGSSSQPSGASSTNSSSPSATSDSASPSGTASTENTGNTGSSGNDLSAGGSLGGNSASSNSSSGSGGSGTVNAGSLPGNSSNNSGTTSVGSNGLPVTTSTSTGGSGNTGNGTNTDGTVGGSSKPHTSIGVIIAIVLVVVLFLAVLALGIRRRHRARRNDRVNKWWFTRNRTSEAYGDRNSTEIITGGARSARSSFATTVDHSTTPNNPGFSIPPLPPMAEVGRTDGRTPTLVIDVSQFGGADPARFSIGSQGSSESQFLVVTHRDSMNTEMAGTPMSVRPFSPSESFAFPKPPDPVDRSSTAYSKRSSTTTVSNKSPDSSPHNSHVEIIPPIPSAPTFPPPALVSPTLFGADPVANPFADNNPFEDTQSTPTQSTPTSASIPTPSPILAPPTASAFAEVEYIKRPFNPSLSDELQVAPDDAVRVLQTFDDGWALVEKVATDDGKGKERHGNYEKGLIPIDCLREPEETLSSFFAVKRVSTYNYAESTRTVSSESPFAFSAF